MSVKDSIYTDPEALRQLYRNPRRPPGLPDDPAPSNTPLTPTTPPIVPPIYHCPTVGEFVMVRIPGFGHSMEAKPVERLRKNVDWVWNPITSIFNKVRAARRIRKVPCVSVLTLDGARFRASLADLQIQSFTDTIGKPLFKMLAESDVEHSVVSCVNFRLQQTFIHSIDDIGLQDVIELRLSKDQIYASGSFPERMTVKHNKGPNTGGIPVEE